MKIKLNLGQIKLLKLTNFYHVQNWQQNIAREEREKIYCQVEDN